jgi:mannose/cellobiose epimerase-like protein (N-acyl-D-glucosamine 2-epimerase family)
MTTNTFELFFALLAIATLATTGILVGARLAAPKQGMGREL